MNECRLHHPSHSKGRLDTRSLSVSCLHPELVLCNHRSWCHVRMAHCLYSESGSESSESEIVILYYIILYYIILYYIILYYIILYYITLHYIILYYIVIILLYCAAIAPGGGPGDGKNQHRQPVPRALQSRPDRLQNHHLLFPDDPRHLPADSRGEFTDTKP